MNLKFVFPLVAAAISLLSVEYTGAQKINIAVVDVGENVGTKEIAGVVLSAVEEELSNSSKFTLVERAQLKKLLEEVAFQQSGVTDQKSAATLGQQLNVDKLVLLRVNRVRQKYQLNLKVVDVQTGSVLRVIDQSLGKKIDAIVEPSKYAARKLIQAASQLISTEMILVRGGKFNIGDIKDISVNPQPVNIDSFYIDPYEVSQIAFAQFKGKTDKLLERPDAPATNVSWRNADAYCRSVGKRLPTEAEWEIAAKGKLDRIYPWGNKGPSLNRALYGGFETEPASVYTLLDGTTPDGVHHLAGNVAEWVSDWWQPVILLGPDNLTGPETGDYKVVRGGSWEDHATDITTTSRSYHTPERGSSTIGFRCAKDLD